jgi:hypothetical protein
MKNPLIQWMSVAVLAFVCCGASLPQLHAQTPRDTTVTIKGKKFAPGVEVYYDSAGVRKRLDTSRVRRIDSKTIRSMIPGWLLNVPGKYPITVQNPSPSRGGSNSDTLTIVRGNAPVRTDTALWFRYVRTNSTWHERVSGTPLSRADSVYLLVSGSPIIEQQQGEGVFYRNGSFWMSYDKQNDPFMANYRDPSLIVEGDPTNREQVVIDGTTSTPVAKITKGGVVLPEQTLGIPSFKPYIDALSAKVEEYPNIVLQSGDTTASKILIATARADGHSVIPIVGDELVVGRGRFKIIMNNPSTNLFGFVKPTGRKYVLRVDTIKNYIESIEVRDRQDNLEVAAYYKLRDDSQPTKPTYEITMIEEYYSLPNSDIRMKFIHTQVYQSFEYKNSTFQKPTILPTR